MYTRSARFYDAIYSFKDYEAEVQTLQRYIEQYKQSEGKTLLDVACGTGKHLEYLRTNYVCTGVDLQDEQLEIARQRCPELDFRAGDMRDFEMGRTFDIITCLFSSIGYLHGTENLQKALNNFAAHLKPGGIVLIEPWLNPDVVEAGRISSLFINEPDLRIARMNLMEIEGRISRMVFHYLVAKREGIEHFTEDHEMWMFTDEENRQAFASAGLNLIVDGVDLAGRGLYIGRK